MRGGRARCRFYFASDAKFGLGSFENDIIGLGPAKPRVFFDVSANYMLRSGRETILRCDVDRIRLSGASPRMCER